MMTRDHAILAMQKTSRKTVFAFVFASSLPTGGTKIIAQEVAMAVMTK